MPAGADVSWQSASMGDTGCAQLFSRTEQINDMVSVQGSEPTFAM